MIQKLTTQPEDISSEYMVSHNEKPTLRELATLFEKVSQKKLNIHWGAVPYRKREILIPWSSGTVVPGWKPKISLEVGIKRMCKDLYEQSR